MTKVFHRNPKQSLPVAVRGEGIAIIDSEGRRSLVSVMGMRV